jgi:hypothetical protein
MKGHGRWTECLATVTELANKAVDCGATGLEFHLFTESRIFKFEDEIQSPEVRCLYIY